MPTEGIGDGFDGVLAAAQTGAGWALERIWKAYAGRVSGYLRVQVLTDTFDEHRDDALHGDGIGTR